MDWSTPDIIKENLKECKTAVKLVRLKENEIKKIKKQSKIHAHGITKGSSDTFPYNERVFSCFGAVEPHPWQKRRVRELRREIKRLSVHVDECSEFVNSIDDTPVRDAVIYYYFKGMTWQWIAINFGGRNEATPRNMVNRYFEKICRDTDINKG